MTSEELALYKSLRPIVKRGAKKRVKNLVKADSLVWADGMSSKQKADAMDLLTGRRARAQYACPTEPVCIMGTEKVATPFLALALVTCSTRSPCSPCSPCSPFVLQCTRVRALHPLHALLRPLLSDAWRQTLGSFL